MVFFRIARIVVITIKYFSHSPSFVCCITGNGKDWSAAPESSSNQWNKVRNLYRRKIVKEGKAKLTRNFPRNNERSLVPNYIPQELIGGIGYGYEIHNKLITRAQGQLLNSTCGKNCNFWPF